MCLDPAYRQRIESLLATGAIAGAAELAEAALAQGAQDPMLFNLAAWRCEERGDFSAALALLDQAWRIAPGDPLIAIAIGAVQRKMGEPERALATLDGLAAAAAELPVYWLERGYVLAAAGSHRSAHGSFARAASLDPALAPAFAGMAEASAQFGDWPAALRHAHDALRLDPALVAAKLVLAMAEIEAGAPDAAAARLQTLLEGNALPEPDRIAALTTLGNAAARLGDQALAFRAFVDAQSRYRRYHAARFGGEEQDHRRLVERLTAEIEATDPNAWCAPGMSPSPAPVFLLGYPRSGTTLVELILAGLPGASAVEEKPLFAQSRDRFYARPGGIARLAELQEPELTGLRQDYWARAAALGARPDPLLIDMDPMKSLYLPVIAKVFPNAKILLMRRDPRDVVWSCFRHNFRISAVNFALSDLEQAARHYAAVMRLIETCRARLPLRIHEIRYEALIADFDGVTQALCTFLEQPWSPALRRFSDRAAGRELTTASATQVRKPLFDGSGQWRRYQDDLAPILPILEPWVERFGYSE